MDARGPATPGTGLVIDRASRTVRESGRLLPVSGRAVDLLAALAAAPGQVVGTDELCRALWPGRTVDKSNLRVHVAALRRLLGAAAIKNVVGRGYLLALAGPPPALLAEASPAGTPTVQPAPLLGRDEDLARVRQLLAQHRLVSLLGTGGTGKTRLAQALVTQFATTATASGAAPSWGTAWWVDMAPLRPGPQPVLALARAVASALGTESPGQPADPQQALLSLGQSVSGRVGLLVLDNAEQVQDAVAALVRVLLRAAPGLRLLVTSQQMLRLPEEVVYALGGLSVPPPRARGAEVRASPAVQLLMLRARATCPDFTLPAADLPAVAAIARAMDGNALALELAGVRLPQLDARRLLRSLGQRLDLGADAFPPHRTGLPPARHLTLRAALDWSYGLLTSAEQSALRQLSVFVAPFRLEAALVVVMLPGHDKLAAIDAVQGLVDKSMLQMQMPASAEAPVRLRLLESPRMYAAEALERSGAGDAARRRHAQAMGEEARRAMDEFWSASDAQWWASRVPEHEDWTLGLRRALDAGDLCSAAWISELLGAHREVVRQSHPFPELIAQALALAPQAQGLTRALLLNLVDSRPLPLQPAQIHALAHERVQAWRDIGDPRYLCMALAFLAYREEVAGNTEAAQAALQACERLEDPAWPPRLRRLCSADAHVCIGSHRGDGAMQILCEPVLADLARAGGARCAAMERIHVALALRLLDRPHEALAVLHDNIQQLQALGFPLGVSHQLGMVCAVWLDLAHGMTKPAPALAQARDAALQALGLQEEHALEVRHYIEALAWLCARLDWPLLAARLLAAGQRLQHEVGYTPHALSARAEAQARALLVQQLDPVTWDQARAEGAALTIEALRLQALAALASGLPAPGARAVEPMEARHVG